MKRITFLLIACSACWPLSSQLLWKITGNNLEKPSYLFGTHHLVDSKDIPHFGQIQERVMSSDAVVGELDLSESGLENKVAMGGSMGDLSIRDLVSPSDYLLLDSAFRNVLEVGIEQLDHMKPMMLLSLHQVASFLNKSGMGRQPISVDELFQNKARNSGKNVFALETIDQQVNLLFNTIPINRQMETLLYSIKHDKECVVQMNMLTMAYVKGDLAAIARLDSMDESTTEDEKKILADNRNLAWMQKLPDMFSKQSCFVVVGCLHLIGENGLINQLRLHGFNVAPVDFTE